MRAARSCCLHSGRHQIRHGFLRERLLGLVLPLVVAACGDLVGNATLPAGTQGPGTYNTPEGALAAYRGVKAKLTGLVQGFNLFVIISRSGALTDELAWAGRGIGLESTGATGDVIDERILPESPTGADLGAYSDLHDVRTHAEEVIGLLRTYAPTLSPALRGEMYALEGYTEILLAELYCSGVPLSTLDFEKDFTYKPSSTTTEVLQHAAALLDTALALSGDSAQALNLARVLKGRVLLDLGDYAAAAQAVADVPDTFRYAGTMTWDNSGGDVAFRGWTVMDQEGGTGLPFVSSGDPRSAVIPVGTNVFGLPLYVPAKYPLGQNTVVLASGVEARLIEAEVALHGGDASWVTILNALRTSGAPVTLAADTIADTLGVSGCATVLCGAGPGGNTPDFGQPPGGFPVPAGYSVAFADTMYPAPAGIQDYCNAHSWYNPCWAGDSMVVLHYVRPARTFWPAGSGGVEDLPPLTDPGSDSARVTLLFTERAYWLFLTGHRQGDLRRLVRNYGRPQEAVYPTGAYFGGFGAYGSDVNLPIPASERPNPLFHGCIDRRA